MMLSEVVNQEAILWQDLCPKLHRSARYILAKPSPVSLQADAVFEADFHDWEVLLPYFKRQAAQTI